LKPEIPVKDRKERKMLTDSDDAKPLTVWVHFAQRQSRRKNPFAEQKMKKSMLLDGHLPIGAQGAVPGSRAIEADSKYSHAESSRRRFRPLAVPRHGNTPAEVQILNATR
jgi:hypothetical protein